MNIDWIKRLFTSKELWAINIKKEYHKKYNILLTEDIDRGMVRIFSVLNSISPFWKNIAEGVTPICEGLLLSLQVEMPIRRTP